MIEWHPTDVALVRLSDEDTGSGVRRHIRSCARCRSVVAEYEWLEAELTTTLKTVAKGISLPRAAWREVQSGVKESRHRQVVRLRASAVVSAAMVVCLLLCVPSLIKPAVAAQALRPEVPLRPTPIAITGPAVAVDGSLSSRTSALLDASRTTQRPSVVPSVMRLPTPPDSES